MNKNWFVTIILKEQFREEKSTTVAIIGYYRLENKCITNWGSLHTKKNKLKTIGVLYINNITIIGTSEWIPC